MRITPLVKPRLWRTKLHIKPRYWQPDLDLLIKAQSWPIEVQMEQIYDESNSDLGFIPLSKTSMRAAAPLSRNTAPTQNRITPNSWVIGQIDAELIRFGVGFFSQYAADRNDNGQGPIGRSLAICASTEVAPIQTALPWARATYTWDYDEDSAFEWDRWNMDSQAGTYWSLMVTASKEYATIDMENALANVTPVVGCHMNVRSAGFDAVTFDFDCRNGSDVAAALIKETLRATAPGGAFLITLRHAQTSESRMDGIGVARIIAESGCPTVRARQFMAQDRFSVGDTEQVVVVAGRKTPV